MGRLTEALHYSDKNNSLPRPVIDLGVVSYPTVYYIDYEREKEIIKKIRKVK